MTTQATEPEVSRGGAPSGRGLVIFILVTAIPVSAVAWLAVNTRTALRTGRARADLPVIAQVPEFKLTDQNGRTLGLGDLRGKVWVADFIFTYCAGPCPVMSTRMSQIQKATADLPGVALVSYSVDPDRDTPAVLREYADRYAADPARWFFLTGDKQVIQMLAVEGFKVGDVKDPILHSTRFVLIDAEGAIRGYYDSEEADGLARLVADIRALHNPKSKI